MAVPTNYIHLPQEILYTICTHLDSESPSETKLVQLPALSWTSSQHQDLKAVSQVSHSFRAAVIPILFTHAQLDPLHLTKFLAFTHNKNLGTTIKTVVANIAGPYTEVLPDWYVRLLDHLPIQRLSICCEPSVVAHLLGVPMNLTDAWAFNIPFQFLEFRQTSHNATTYGIPSTPSSTLNLYNIRPWKSIRINEGSSIAAYTSYEYFLKQTPSVFTRGDYPLDPVDLDPGFEMIEPPDAIHPTSCVVQDFSYIATFPFYNHFCNVLASIQRMHSLETLYIKICPDLNSDVLEAAIGDAGGHFDINDPWNEANVSYMLLAHTMNALQRNGNLKSCIMDDLDITVFRDSIMEQLSIILLDQWNYDGARLWSCKQSDTTEIVHADVT